MTNPGAQIQCSCAIGCFHRTPTVAACDKSNILGLTSNFNARYSWENNQHRSQTRIRVLCNSSELRSKIRSSSRQRVADGVLVSKQRQEGGRIWVQRAGARQGPGASRQRPRGRGQSGRGQQTEANMHTQQAHEPHENCRRTSG